jgi:hypothetical protein
MAYLASLNTYTAVEGTTLVTTADHASMHNMVGSAIVQLETTIGTNSGTAILKDATAGKFAVMNSGGTLNDGVLGTPMMRGGTVGTALIGSCNITGGTFTGGTITANTIGTTTIIGGTANNLVLGTPTIKGGSIAIDGTTTALTIGAGLVPTSNMYADTAGGTIMVNAQAGNIARIVFGTTAGNRTIGTPLNPTSDQSFTFAIQASGSANGTIVWDTTAFNFSEAGTPAIGTASTWNYYSWRYNALGTVWDYMGESKNII